MKSRFRVHLMQWITISQSLLVVIPNWCGEKCVVKYSQNWRHKVWLVNWYNVSLIVIGWTPFKGLIMVKKWATPRTCAIWGGMWPCVKWNKVGTIEKIHSLNFLGENNPKTIQKPSQNDHLSINAAYVGMSTWRN